MEFLRVLFKGLLLFDMNSLAQIMQSNQICYHSYADDIQTSTSTGNCNPYWILCPLNFSPQNTKEKQRWFYLSQKKKGQKSETIFSLFNNNKAQTKLEIWVSYGVGPECQQPHQVS